MKHRLIKYISLLIALLSVVTSFAGCLDFDEFLIDIGFYRENKRVNEQVEVLFRECDGVTLKDKKAQVSVYKGERVSFVVEINPAYVYLGNSANAEYNTYTKKLIISSVKAPMTVDVYVEPKVSLHYVECYVYNALTGEECTDVTVDLASGNIWERQSHEVTLQANLGDDYTVVCWSVGDKYFIDHSSSRLKIAGVSEQLDYTVSEMGIHRIYLNVVPKNLYDPNMSPPINMQEGN